MILMEPTSLNGGEGLMMGSPDNIGDGVGASKGGGGWRRGWWWTNKSEVQMLMELM